MGGLMRMTFWAAISSSADGCVAASGVAFSPATVPGTSGGGGSAALFGGGAGLRELAAFPAMPGCVKSAVKRLAFGFTSPSAIFLFGFFRSISETLSASRVEGRAVSGADFESGGVPGLSAGADILLYFLLWKFCLGWDCRFASSSRPPRGRFACCSFAARLCCHCCSFKILLMARASLNQSHVIVRVPADGRPRKSLAPLSHPLREYPLNPAHPHRAILPGL